MQGGEELLGENGVDPHRVLWELVMNTKEMSIKVTCSPFPQSVLMASLGFGKGVVVGLLLFFFGGDRLKLSKYQLPDTQFIYICCPTLVATCI